MSDVTTKPRPSDNPSECYADPYKKCDECGGWVWWMNAALRLVPCGHRSSYSDVCPSWGPVDGCCCEEVLGERDHPIPPDDVLAGRLP